MIFDQEFVSDPYPTYARLRADGGVHRVHTPDGLPAWLITRYADVRAGLADPRLSLNRNNARGDGYRGFALPPALDANLLNLDPPDHTRLRALIAGAFTPARVDALGPLVRSAVDDLLNEIKPDEPVDLMDAFAAPLPVRVIGDLLGIPVPDRARFRSWTTTLLAPKPGQPKAAAAHAVAGIHQYLVDLIRAKREQPAADLLSALISVRDNDDRLTETELVSMAFLTLWAGYENVVNLIGNSVFALLRHPEQLAELVADPALMPTAVDELTRYDQPLQFAIRRFPTEDVEINGTTITAGETVLLAIASANHDETRFTDPHVLDLRRDPNPHLSYGHGIHRSFGSRLSQLETTTALTALLHRRPELAVPADRVAWGPSFRNRGLAELPVIIPG